MLAYPPPEWQPFKILKTLLGDSPFASYIPESVLNMTFDIPRVSFGSVASMVVYPLASLIKQHGHNATNSHDATNGTT